MSRDDNTRTAWIWIIISIALIFVVALYWRIQGASRVDDFVDAMRNGEVQISQVHLRDKVWTDEELATVEVLRLPDSFSKEQSLSRAVHLGSGYTISRHMYSYQATMTDLETGNVHLFGFPRNGPQVWRWESIHPDSMRENLERMQEEGGR